jgi:hypothetical protein
VRFALAFVCIALGALSSRPARAYAWMVRHGYTTCATCHVDPSGSGVLTPYGRAQGEILLQSRYGKPAEEASPAANFLWNALRTPEWLLGGGEVRYMGLRTKVGDGPTIGDLILMQGDLAAAVHAGGFRASASLGYITTTGSPASVAGQVVSREHWAGWAFGEEGELLVRAGRMIVPFGVRSIEHTMFVRQATRTDLNDTQQHGVAVAYSGERIRGELMAIVGNFQIRPDSVRERGYSGYVEVWPLSRLGVGVSSLVTHASQDVYAQVPNTRQAHGAFVRASPWTALALLAEADYVIQDLSGASTKKGLATMLQADFEPWQGVHLIATGETLDTAGAGISYGGWLSAAWFFAPHLDIRADLVNRSEVVGASRYAVLAYMAQGHVYF